MEDTILFPEIIVLIGGGAYNAINGISSIIAGGANNHIRGQYSVIGGGRW